MGPEEVPVHDPEADWQCKGCGDMNRPDALRCITCNMDAPKANTPAANSEGDGSENADAASKERWTCPKCDEVNKPNREKCNACGARNPALPALPEEKAPEDDHLRAVFVEPAAKKAKTA